MNQRAVMVAQHLNFNVMDFGKKAFENNVIVTERISGLTAGGLQIIKEAGFVPDDAHPFAAAACAGFDENGETNGNGRFHQHPIVQSRAVHTGRGWHTRRFRHSPRRRFITHQPHRRCAGANEGDVCLRAGSGKIGVFTQKAVAGMDRVCAATFGDTQHHLLIEIGVRRADARQWIAFVSQPNPRRVCVWLGVDGDRTHAQLAARIHNTVGDFAPISD